MSTSASSSPLRKKPRLSSPTYDDQFADLETYDFQALDDIELRLSQEINPTSLSSHTSPSILDRKEKRRRAIEDALNCTKADGLEGHDDSGIILVKKVGDELDMPQRLPSSSSWPVLPQGSDPKSASTLPLTANTTQSDPVSTNGPGCTSSTSLVPLLSQQNAHTDRSPSPEGPPEVNHDAWFAPVSMPLPTTFTPATALRPVEDVAMAPAVFERASGKSWVPPSSTALETAKKKLQVWQAEIESELSTLEQQVSPKDRLSTPDREPLKGVENSVVPVNVSGFNSASARHDDRPVPPPREFKPLVLTTPVLNNNHSQASSSANFNPIIARSSAAASINLSKAPVASSSTPSTPLRGSTSTSTAHRSPQTPELSTFITPKSIASSHHPDPGAASQKAKPLGLTPRAHAFSSSTRRKFVTPFKQGMRPGEPTREVLLRASQPKPQPQPQSQYEGKGKGRDVKPSPMVKAEAEAVDKHNFNHSKPSNRKNLVDSGLRPRFYTHDELTDMGLDAGLFNLTSVSHFLYYRFNPADINIPAGSLASTQASLGSDSALEVLLGMGCHLATKAWVDNHWSLILWKMIGMACLDPTKLEKTWSWCEVMRQLRYRYTRELANGSRPALRLITTQDAPASGPLVLCVSNVFWADEYVDAEGRLVPAHPELELTDGWYCLRATVDEALAKATRNKILRVGMKIACSGARLELQKKEPMEVLEAYGGAHLIISGNSAHLAPWHAKLGFQTAPFVATLGSLSADGGTVALMDLMISQVFPVGFIEFITTDGGEVIREGPRTSKDEELEEDKWKERRSHLAARLREDLEKKLHKLESYADRLERIAGSGFHPTEDETSPNNIEDLAEELEESGDPASFIRGVNKKDAGWLSQFLRSKCETDRESSGEEIDKELATSFPPRQVRNFQVLRVKDARTMRKPAWRSAQLTVWDAMALESPEGGSSGSFAVGQRYMITSLVPSQQSAWMGLEPGSEVYLSTRRDSKWRLVN